MSHKTKENSENGETAIREIYIRRRCVQQPESPVVDIVSIVWRPSTAHSMPLYSVQPEMSILICITDKPAQFFFPQFGHANAQKKERKRHRKLTVPDMLMHRIASAHVHFTRGLISFSFLVVSFQQNQTHRSIWPTLCNGFSLCHFHFVFIDCFFFPRFVINNNDNALLVNIVGIFASCLLHHPFGEQVCPARVVPYQKKYNIDGCKIGNFSIFENHDQ